MQCGLIALGVVWVALVPDAHAQRSHAVVVRVATIPRPPWGCGGAIYYERIAVTVVHSAPEPLEPGDRFSAVVMNCGGIPAGCLRLSGLDDFDLRAAAAGRQVPSVGDVAGRTAVSWERVRCR